MLHVSESQLESTGKNPTPGRDTLEKHQKSAFLVEVWFDSRVDSHLHLYENQG